MASDAPARILVVEDEPDILEMMRYNLEKAGHEVICATSGEAGVTAARNTKPDVILLDLMLPGMDGLSVCRTLKADANLRHVPVMMVTARGTEEDIVSGLTLGADDYMVKPFSPKVLVARVTALLRRGGASTPGAEEAISRHGINLDPGRHQVAVDGANTRLTATEFGILHFLLRRPGWVFTRGQIVDGVKGASHVVTERSVDVQVAAIRKKLGTAGKVIETVRGVGYRMKE